MKFTNRLRTLIGHANSILIAAGMGLLSLPNATAPAATIGFGQPYMNGCNIPWNQFGADFGVHPQWGALYDSTWFENVFAELQANRVNTARIWVHADGRSSPEFNGDGSVSGVDSSFYPNLDDFLNRARNHGIKVILVLWSFDMCIDYAGSMGSNAGMHANLITDSAKYNSYINNVLKPMVERYATHEGVSAWEVFNEPEWCVNDSGSAWTGQRVSLSQYRTFVSALVAAIKTKTSQPITCSASSMKWNSDVSGMSGNWHKDLGLDFYSIHYYDEWQQVYNFDPFANGRGPFYYGLDKPCIISEFRSWGDTGYSPTDMLNRAWNNGYAGHFPFAYAATACDCGTWDNSKSALKTFAETHNLSGSGSSSGAPIGEVIALKSLASGKYVSTNLGAENVLVAQWADDVRDWEKYRVDDAGGGYVGLYSLASGKYVVADVGWSERGLWAGFQSNWIGDWEKFQWIDAGNGEIALKAFANGYYVSTDMNRADRLLRVALQSSSTGAWERFAWESNMTISATANSSTSLGNSTASTRLHQSFVAPDTKIIGVNVGLSKAGAPNYNITASIRSTLTGANLASATITPAQVASASGSSPSSVRVQFPTALTVTKGGTYYLTLTVGTTNSASHYRWSTNTSNPYSGGRFWQGSTGQAAQDAVSRIYHRH